MSVTIALAGNPNCGKTTLFNALTGSNQFVGNWPGVTVEKKEGKMKGAQDVYIMDLPGIYSLSPYTLEEVVARSYLIDEAPDAILNIVDGSNIERNLYLSTQLTELGIPVVIAVNMMDIVEKNGDKIDFSKLGEKLGCEVMAISALKEDGIREAAQKAAEAAENKDAFKCSYKFSSGVEKYIQQIERKIAGDMSPSKKRFYAVKLFEKDNKIGEKIQNPPNVEDIIRKAEKEFDDDSESIITNERYNYITKIIKDCYKKAPRNIDTVSDKIDKIVTNRWLALPIFAAVMFMVYYISVTTIGTWATDWANDGVFGEGWHLFRIGSAEYEEAATEWDESRSKVEAFIAEAEKGGINTNSINETLKSEEADKSIIENFAERAGNIKAEAEITDENGEIKEIVQVTPEDFKAAANMKEPDPSSFGVWIWGVPVIAEWCLDAVHTADWMKSLIIDGIISGVGAVLGFVPQMFVLFIFLAFLEACGYMSRVAFIMDRIFRKFGLSGKSFIPMLIGSGCGVPGIMASRTIENISDRRMTIITTTFIPCGAKLPMIALIAGALFGGAWWVSPSAYFIGIAAVIMSGIILKKTKMFAGNESPFVMELPAYHMPTAVNILRSMWERGWSFIKKAGTIILLSTIVLWFLQSFGYENGFCMVKDINNSILARAGSIIAPLFIPLGWGNWKAAVATITGLIAKENVVGTLAVLYGSADGGTEMWNLFANEYTPIAAYSLIIFNLLCAPCFAAIGAIRREMNSSKWTWFAIGYQTGLAYTVSLCIYQVGNLIINGVFGIGTAAAILCIAVIIYLLIRPNRQSISFKKGKSINA